MRLRIYSDFLCFVDGELFIENLYAIFIQTVKRISRTEKRCSATYFDGRYVGMPCRQFRMTHGEVTGGLPGKRRRENGHVDGGRPGRVRCKRSG